MDLREKLSKGNPPSFHTGRSRRSRSRSPYYRKRSRSRGSRYHTSKSSHSRSRSKHRHRRRSRSKSRSSSNKTYSASRYKRKRKFSSSSSSSGEERTKSFDSKTWKNQKSKFADDGCTSSSPSPPRYDDRPQSSSAEVSAGMSSFGMNRSSIFLSGKSIEECRAQIRKEMTYLREQDLLMQKNSKIETIDIDSETDIPGAGDNKIVIPGLGVNVTEMELRRSLGGQNLNHTEPSKITFSKLSGKCDAILHFDDIRAAEDYKKHINQTSLYSLFGSSGLSSPGVSPPRFVDNTNSLHILDNMEEPDICHKPFNNTVIPIFVDIQSEDGIYINKIKVNLQTHGKCQQFFGQEPKILISAFLNYMKKYFPTKEGLELIFVAPCPAAYTLFYSVLKENIVNKQVFDFYFTFWTDLQSAVRGLQSGHRTLAGCSYHIDKISQLWEHVKYPEKVSGADSVIIMKLIFDEYFLPSGPPFPGSYAKLLEHSSPCILPNKRYLTTLLHVGIVEADIQHHGKVLPVIACLGFKNSNKGSWFVPVDPERVEGNLIMESATKVGFLRKEEKWSWNDDSSIDCIPEREALECLIKALVEEREAGQAEGVVLLTPRYDVSLALLISALEKHNLLDSFLRAVDGLGDMEMLAVNNNIQFKSSGLRAYQDYYNHQLGGGADFSRPENVAPAVYRILENILSGHPNYENLHRLYIKPVNSPYINKLLYNSQILEIREDYHRISVIDKVSLRPGGYEILSLQVKTASKTDIGQEYFVFGYGKLKFGWSKSKLAPNLHLVLPVQNMTAGVITLEPGHSVGLAHRENNFNFPTSLYRKKYEPKYFPGKKEEDKKAFFKDDFGRFKRETSRDLCKSEDLKVYDKSKLAESLPFGDIIEKYNRLKEDLKKASQEEPVGSASEKVSRRDPRLQKLKEKQEKSLLYQPPPTVPIPQPAKKPISPPPIINLDLSKDQICHETLQQVDEEMKAIAVTVFPKANLINSAENRGKDASLASLASLATPKTAFYKQNLSSKEHSIHSQHQVRNQEINHPSKHETPSVKTKTVVQSKEIAGACFDFLSESKPKERSFKYLSKREELSRKQVKKAREKFDSVPDSTKDLKEMKPNISQPKITQEEIGDNKTTVKISTNHEERRKKHSKKRSDEKDEEIKHSSVQKKKKKKDKKRHEDSSPSKHERTAEKKKKEIKTKPESTFLNSGDKAKVDSTGLKCKLCREEFSVRKSYRRHFKTAHIYKCRKCPLKFNSEEKRKTHALINHSKDFEVADEVVLECEIEAEMTPPQINICSLCGDSFKTSLELTEHISSPHIATCFDCDLMFVDFQSLHNHKQTHNPISEVVPESVKLITTSQTTSKAEGADTNKKKRKVVKVEALSEMAMIVDVADLIKIDSLLIEKSKETPLEESSSETGNKVKKGSEENHCKTCAKVFSTEKDLFHHSTLEHFENWSYTDSAKNIKRTQSGWNINDESDGPFTCNLCSEVFKLWGSLLKHLWAPHFFKCEYCGKSFNRNTKLEDHVNKEHDFVGFIDTTKCGLCGETFGRSSSLARHINAPHNFQCNRCPLRFPIKSALTKHKKTCTKGKMMDILEDCIPPVTS